MSGEPNTFKRSQVEWALWQHISHGSSNDPPKALRTRIKRLLEIDREKHRGTGEFAFCRTETSGQGTDAAFELFDVFCLALTLHLMHAGIKQSMVVTLMQHFRGYLWGHFDDITSRPAPKGRPRTVAKAMQEDRRVFAVFYNVDMAKELSKSDRPKIRLTFKEPEISWGLASLTSVLNRMDAFDRQTIVMELAHMAHDLEQALMHAPIAKRGRQ